VRLSTYPQRRGLRYTTADALIYVTDAVFHSIPDASRHSRMFSIAIIVSFTTTDQINERLPAVCYRMAKLG